jgi:hypothetical protein
MALHLRDLIAAQRELKSADGATKQESLSIAEFRKIVAESEDSDKRVEVKLQKIVDASAQEKEVQLSILEEAKASKDVSPIDKDLLDQFKDLNAKFDKSNSNSAKLFDEAKKHTASFQALTKKQLTDNSVKSITEKATNQPQFKTIGERIGDVKDNIKNFFTVKGFLNKTGIVDEKSTGFIANAINRRQAKKDYVDDRFNVDGKASVAMAAGKLAKKDGKEYAKLTSVEKEVYNKQAEPGVRESFANKFEEQQAVKKDIRQNQKEVERLQKAGYTSEQIQRSPAGKKQVELAEAYAKADTRAKGLVEYKQPLDKSNVKPTEKQQEPLSTQSSMSTAPEEVANENQRLFQEQLDVLNSISENTAETNRLLGAKPKKEDKEEKPPEKKGIFGTITDALSDIPMPGRGGRKTPPGRPGGAGGLGGKLLKGAKGFGIGSILGIGGDLAADALGRDTKAGATADTLGQVASYAGTGALIGSVVPGVGTLIGGAVGGVAGAAKGLYDNWGTLTAKPTPVAKNEGAIVYNQSAQTASMKDAVSMQPIVVAPVNNTSNNNKTNITKFDLSTRKDDGSLNRYTGSRLAY